METMDIPVTQLPPGDPRLVEAIVGQLKSKGIFDQFRKECLADVDTKPAFQNLRQRVEGQVNKYLDKQIWKNDMNKNQVREGVRKHVNELGILESGIDAIITQVVNPKIKPLILPYVEDTVYTFLQIDKPKRGITEPDPEPDPEPVNEPVNQPDIEYSHGNSSEKNAQYPHGNGGPEQQTHFSHSNIPDQKPALLPKYSHGNGPDHKAVHGYGNDHKSVHGYGPDHKTMHGYVPDQKVAHGYVPDQKAAVHGYGSEPQAAILPTDTEMVSSEEDEILARESPPTARYTAQKPQEIKNEDENARDGFSMDTDSPEIDVQQDIIASNVEKLKLDDTYDESGGPLLSTAGSMKAPMQLFDNQSLDSISSNSSGLSSPKTKQISPIEKQNRPIETSSRHEESMEDENLSRSSTPLVDEKRVGVMDDTSLISSGPSPSGSPTNDSDKMPPSPRYAPGEASPAHSVASNTPPEKDNITFLSGASPISQDEDSRISGGSFSRVSVASEKSDVEETAKSEKSEGEITSSSSESGESDTKSRLSEKIVTEEKTNEEKDSSQISENKESSQKSSSKSSSKDHKSSHRSHSREREKDRDKDSSRHSSKDREKERKSSKSRDDHHSHRDKDKKHYRKDKDHDGDRDKSRHHSSSSSHRDGSGSSSNKSSDKDKSSHKSSGDKGEGQNKRESSHEKSDRKHSSSSKSSESKSSDKSDKKSSNEKPSSNKQRRDSKDERSSKDEKSKSHREHHRHDSKERKSKKDEDLSKEKPNSSSRHESKTSSSKNSKSSSHSSSNSRKRHSSDSRRSESHNISKEKEQTLVANRDKTISSDIEMSDDISEDRKSIDGKSELASNKEITKDANMNIKSYSKGKIVLYHCEDENAEISNSEINKLKEKAIKELASVFDSDDEMSEFEGFENSPDDDFDNIVPDFEGFENILTDQTILKMIIYEADLKGKVTMESFLHCCRNLGAVVSEVGEEILVKDDSKTLQVKNITGGVDRSEGKKRRYSTSSSASSSQSPTGSPKHKRAKLNNSATAIIENSRVIVSGYALLTPEDDGNRTSSRDYEVDYSQRCNSYSPLSPASDSSADDGKHKLADAAREAGDLKNRDSLKSPKTFKNRGKVIIPI